MAINIETHEDFNGVVNPADSDYVFGSYKDQVGGVPGTGTRIRASGLNDIVGCLQSILVAGNVNPNGTPDSVTNPQYLTAINNIISDALPTDEQRQDFIATMLTDGDQSGITVAYDDNDGTIDFTISGEYFANGVPLDGSLICGDASTYTAVVPSEIIMATGSTGIAAQITGVEGLELQSDGQIRLTSSDSVEIQGMAIPDPVTANNGDVLAFDSGDLVFASPSAGGTTLADVGGMVSGNTESGGITVTYQSADDTLDFELQSMSSATDTSVDGQIVRTFDTSKLFVGHGAGATGGGLGTVGIGKDALKLATSASVNNTVIGAYAGDSVTASSHLVLIGQQAASNLGECDDIVSIGYKSLASVTASSARGVAVGTSANTQPGSSDFVAVGNGADANGSDTVAVGSSALAAAYGVAAGSSANAAAYGTAVGYAAGVTSNGVGVGANCTATDGVSVGQEAVSLDNGVAVGAGAVVGDRYGVAVGRNATIADTCTYAVAVGYNASVTAPGSGSVAVGANTGGNDVSIGNGATGSGPTGIAIGSGSDSGTGTGISIGVGATNTGLSGVAVGYNTSAEGGCVSIGYDATTTNRGVAIGYNASAGSFGVAIGDSTTAASYETIIGNGNTNNTLIPGNVTIGAYTSGEGVTTTLDGALLQLLDSPAPASALTDSICLHSTSIGAGNTTLSLHTEGTPVAATAPGAATHTISIKVNGTTYKLHATT